MKLKLLIFILVLFSTNVLSQSPSKILSNANKAAGGEKVLRSVKSRIQRGTITRQLDGRSGKFESQSGGGNFYSENFDLNGFEYALGFNGKSGWKRDSRDGLRTLTGDAAVDFQAEVSYKKNLWLKVKDEKVVISNAGNLNVNGKNTNCLMLTNAKAVQIKMCFDMTTNLLVHEEIPRGNLVLVNEFSDFQTVNGIKTPFKIISKFDDETFEIKLDEVKYNASVELTKFAFPNISNEPLPDIAKLLEEIRANAEKLDEILENYSFTEQRIDRDLDANGNFVEKSSEKMLLTFYKGFRIRRLIEKNGKPLSVSDQEKEDRDVQKQVEDIEKKIAQKERKEEKQRETGAGRTGQPNGEGQRVSLGDALKGSLLVNPRRERFKGIEVIVFDYEPNPAYKPQTRMEKLFALCTGTVWVDAKTKQVVRLDAVLTKSAGNFIAKAKRGASFSLENTLINNEIWLPAQADVNLSVKILFAGININNLIKYGDYSKFSTEVKDASVDEIKKP